MKTLLLNDEGDLVLEQGSFLWIEGDEELAQSVRVLLKTAKEEWFLNEGFGLEREPILAKSFNEVEARDSLVEALAQEPRIASVEKIVFSRQGRTLFIDIELKKQDGSILSMQEVTTLA